jgi:signal transduction histidine kinase
MATRAAPAVNAENPARTLALLGGLVALGCAAATVTALRLGDASALSPDELSYVRGLGVAIYVLAGVYLTWRRPGSRFGLYLAGTGLLLAVAALNASDDELAHTIGRIMFALYVVCLAYVLLAHPHDSLGSTFERKLMGVIAVSTGILWLLALPFIRELPVGGALADCSGHCPGNAFQLVSTPHALSETLENTVSFVTAAGLLAVGVVLADKARSPSRLRRRLVVPLLLCASLLAINYAVFVIVSELGVERKLGFAIVAAVATLAIPVVIVAGQVRGRIFAATSLGQLVSSVSDEPVTPARIEVLLQEALGDPSLRLALWAPRQGGYVDVHGDPVELRMSAETVVTYVERDGRPLAALVHDSLLDEASGVARGLAATSLLLLEHTHLIEELRASRARLAASQQQERLRLERDLHDGAQQRLFAIQIKLDALEHRIHDPNLAHELNDIALDAEAAVDELRTLAHGLYPALLRERGLPDALRSIALGAAVPVRIDDRGIGRCPPTIEEAVYFCVREAIQNTTKHGGPNARVTVTLERRGDDLDVVVADDGSGFDVAEHGDGIGLVSMRDRIGAVGELEIASRPGRGTTVHAVIAGCWSADFEAGRPLGG